MIKISNAKLLEIHRFLLEVNAVDDLDKLRRLIPLSASRLINADRVNFNVFDLAKAHQLIVPAPVPSYWERLCPILFAHMGEHPLMNGDEEPQPNKSVRFSDLRREDWNKSVLYNEYYIPAGARHQLSTHLLSQGSERFNLAFNRSHMDFNSRDQVVIELIAPHISQIWKNVTNLCSLRRESISAPSVTKAEHIIVVNRNLSISSHSLRACDVLSKCFKASVGLGGRLPDLIERFILTERMRIGTAATALQLPKQLCVRQSSARLDIRVVLVSEMYCTIVITEVSPRHRHRGSIQLKLSAREEEILFWVRDGKRNKDIASILGMSHRTVAKHLENIFDKLGVDNRTGAANYASINRKS